MALKRFTIDGYGQIELNNVAFRRDGRVEAQCKLDDKDFAEIVAENGMLLAVDKANGVIKFAVDDTLPIAVHYSSEHMYDERTPGLKNFALPRDNTFLPRMGYPAVGDLWTSNTLCYDDGEFTDDDALKAALEKVDKTPIYGGISGAEGKGAVKLSKTAPSVGPVIKVVKYYTMPNGTPGVKLQVLKA
jgi:hypothetical protein